MATTDKKIILMPSPVAWMFKITGATTEPVVSAAITETYLFDNLAKGGKVIVYNPLGSETTGENLDILRADGGITRFPKFNLVLDGTDEKDITPADQSDDATKKGRFELITNEAPLPNSINSMTAFVKSVKDDIDALWLVVIGTGFTYNSRELATPKVDGWVYQIGKIVNDIELDFSENMTLKLDIESYKCKLAGVDAALLELVDFTPITWKGKGVTFEPAVLLEADCDDLIEGKVVIKTGHAYTY